MATISQEKDLEMLRKNADGTYTKYNPKTKASNVILGNGQNVESQLGDIEKQLSNYNSYASGKDDNGIYTVVDYKRTDNTLYMKSTLSNLDTSGNYQTMTWEFYDGVGTIVISTVLWTIAYDEDGNIISKVVS